MSRPLLFSTQSAISYPSCHLTLRTLDCRIVCLALGCCADSPIAFSSRGQECAMRKRWMSCWVASGGGAVGEPWADRTKLKHWPAVLSHSWIQLVALGQGPVYWPTWYPSPSQSLLLMDFLWTVPSLDKDPCGIDLIVHLFSPQDAAFSFSPCFNSSSIADLMLDLFYLSSQRSRTILSVTLNLGLLIF